MDASRFHCSICNIYIQGTRNIFRHIKTKEHEANFNNSKVNVNNINLTSEAPCVERKVPNRIDKEDVPVQYGFPTPAADHVTSTSNEILNIPNPKYPHCNMNNCDNIENTSKDPRMRRPFSVLSKIIEEPSPYQVFGKNEESKLPDSQKIYACERTFESLRRNQLSQIKENCDPDSKTTQFKGNVNVLPQPPESSVNDTTILVNKPINTRNFTGFKIKPYNHDFSRGCTQINNTPNENQKSDKFNIFQSNKFIDNKNNNNLYLDGNIETIRNSEELMTSPTKLSPKDNPIDNVHHYSNTKTVNIECDLLPECTQANIPDHRSQTIINYIDSQNKFVCGPQVESQLPVETNDSLCLHKNNITNDVLLSSVEQCTITKFKDYSNHKINNMVEVLYEPLYIDNDFCDDKFKGLNVTRKQLDLLSASKFSKLRLLLGKKEKYSFASNRYLSFAEITQLMEQLFGKNDVEVEIIYPKQKKSSKNKQDLKNQYHASKSDQKCLVEKFYPHIEPCKVDGLTRGNVENTTGGCANQAHETQRPNRSCENLYPNKVLHSRTISDTNILVPVAETYNENISSVNTNNPTKDSDVTSSKTVSVENINEDQEVLLKDMSHKYVDNIFKEYIETKDFQHVTLPDQTYLVYKFQHLLKQKVEQCLNASAGQSIPLLEQQHILQQCKQHIVSVIDQHVAQQLIDNINPPDNFSESPDHKLDQNISTAQNSPGKEMQTKILTSKGKNKIKPKQSDNFHNQPNHSRNINKQLYATTEPKRLCSTSSSDSLLKSIQTQNMTWADVANIPQVSADSKGMKRSKIEPMPIKGILKVKGGFVMNEKVMIDTYSYNAVVKSKREGMRCLLCDEAVKIHITNHLMETRHITNTADHPYSDKYGLHLVRIVDVFSSQYYHCGLCNQIFAKELELLVHINTDGHNNNMKVAETNAETALKDKSNIKVIPTRKARKVNS